MKYHIWKKVIISRIGKRIKLARKKSKFTQEQLAEKLSLSSKYISQLERGLTAGSVNTLIDICKVLNISSDFLFEDSIKGSSSITDIFEQSFIEDYMKLNTYSKSIVNTFTHSLLKLQIENAKKARLL